MRDEHAVRLIRINAPCEVRSVSIERDDGRKVEVGRGSRDPLEVVEEFLEIPVGTRVGYRLSMAFRDNPGLWFLVGFVTGVISLALLVRFGG